MKLYSMLALGIALSSCAPMNEAERKDTIIHPYQYDRANPTNNAGQESLESILPDKGGIL